MTAAGEGSLRPVLAACAALAAASLLLPGGPSYDPWAWIIWGREIVELDLATTDGPSWKPLPMLFTVPFAALGDGVAPGAWLLVARAGGLLAIVMAYRLGARLAGPGAGAVAALSLAASESFVRHFWRGFSEGLLVGLVLWAAERHLQGRRGQSFALGVAAGLLRPEVWLFVAGYGLYLLWREPGHRLVVPGAGALTLAAWFLPEYIGSGNAFRAATRAMEANLDSPAYASRPWLEVFERSSDVLAPPVLALAVAGTLLGARRRVVRVLAIAAAALMGTVAVMTELGFAGNLRYVALPAALVCLLAGVGAAGAARLGGRWVAAALVVAALPFAVAVARDLREDARLVGEEARRHETAALAVAAAGGRERVDRCGGVWTGRFEVPVIAWELHRHFSEVGIFPFPPGHLFALRGSPLSRDPRFDRVAETTGWVVRASCGPS